MFTYILMFTAAIVIVAVLLPLVLPARPQAQTARERRQPAHVPNWVWQKLLQHNIPFERVTIRDLIGRPNDGKSVLLSSFAKHVLDVLCKLGVRLIEISPRLRIALEDLESGNWPEKTAVCDPNLPEEYVIVQDGDDVHVLIAQPGDILNPGGAINPTAARHLFGEDEQMGVVINAWRSDEDLAHRGLLGIIATLQAEPLNYDFGPAVLTGCELLYGWDRQMVESYDLDWAEIEKHPAARLEWQPATAGNPGKILFHAPGGDCNKVKRTLANLARYAVRPSLEGANMRELIRQNADEVVVCLSKLDMLPLIPTVQEADFERVFDSALGSHDCWLSQRVLTKNTLPLIRPDSQRPMRFTLDDAGGAALWTSQKRMTERKRVSHLPWAMHVRAAAVAAVIPLVLTLATAVLAWSMQKFGAVSGWAWGSWAILAWGVFVAYFVCRNQPRAKRLRRNQSQPTAKSLVTAIPKQPANAVAAAVKQVAQLRAGVAQ
jgi:hypothetical protein